MTRIIGSRFFLVILLIVLLSSCENFSLQNELGLADITSSLSLSPATPTMAVNQSLDFTVTGGIPPYEFSIVSGPGVINPDTGAYMAHSTPGIAMVQVKDQEEVTRIATVTIIDPSITLLTLIPSPAANVAGPM